MFECLYGYNTVVCIYLCDAIVQCDMGLLCTNLVSVLNLTSKTKRLTHVRMQKALRKSVGLAAVNGKGGSKSKDKG